MSGPFETSKTSTWVPAWIDQLAMPVWVTGNAGTITCFNDRAEHLFGKSATSCLGEPCHSVIGGCSPDGKPFCGPQCGVRRLAAANRPIEPLHMKLRGHGRSQHASVIVIPTRGPQPDDVALVHCVIGDERETRIASYFENVLERTPHEGASEKDELRGRLTRREFEILSLLARDKSLDEIAEHIGVSYVTVRNHTQHIRKKLDVHTTLEAIVLYLLTD